MTEKEFWDFLQKERNKGKAQVFAGSFESRETILQGSGEYMAGHALLPGNCDKIPQEKIIGMGKLLLRRSIKIKTKESILILLAHQSNKDALFFLEEYNKYPDKELQIFSELALQECMFWNDE